MIAFFWFCSSEVYAAADDCFYYGMLVDGAQISMYMGNGGEVVIPDTANGVPVISLGDYLFQNNGSITSVSIPASVTSIGKYVFSGCRNLQSIEVDGSNLYYQSIDGVLYDKTGTILIACPDGAAQFTIPAQVTNIGEAAFHDCVNLTAINIPQGVTSIGNQAFAWCIGLKTITVDPNNIYYTAKDGLLYDKSGANLIACPGSLSAVSIPPGVSGIGVNAFNGCTSLTSISLPKEITSIGRRAFYDCRSLNSITLNSPITSIYDEKDTIPHEAKIKGYDPSTAKDYARKYSLTFVSMGSPPPAIIAPAKGTTPIVLLNGQQLAFQVPPVIENGRTLVPLRAIFEPLGATVQWDADTQTVTSTKGSTVIALTLGQTTAYINNNPVLLSVPAKAINGRTMVPLRFVSEALGCEVNWDADTYIISIESQNK